jgi:deoxyadenosine/deoxycytidine kinase
VIIWLDGPFGIGKSTTAQALLEHLPEAVLFDPELFGALESFGGHVVNHARVSQS